MGNLPILLTVLFLHFLALVSPGPDFIMAVRNSLLYSRRIGIYTALGFGIGIMVHITYCALGLAYIISKSIFAFNIIKAAGALYLCFIGFKTFFAKSTTAHFEPEKKAREISPLQAVKIGFLTNALNPKATLFFLGLFTLVIAPATPPSLLVLMGIAMVTNTIIWFSLVAIFFTQPRIQAVFNRWEKLFNKVLGTLLMAVGIKIVFSK